MKKYADLEISLHRRDTERYRIELRFNHPDSDTDNRLIRDGPVWIKLEEERLQALALDDAAYGKLLGESLLAPPEVRAGFDNAFSIAQSLSFPLRVRIFIGPNASELHSVRWETLRDPRDGSLLFTREHLLFSRYLSSSDWRPVRLRPQAKLHALFVIASPIDLPEYHFTPIDVFEERKRTISSLERISVTELTSQGEASLKNLITHLRDGYDILYLVCHGKLVDNEPWLWLEDESGKSHRVSGDDLLVRLQELEHRPRLVVLASCQSAGTGSASRERDQGTLVSLGPRLAEAGIPAVIAMQGKISIKTVEEFMSVFFRELLQDGQIDRAMALARGMVRERPDWWMPVLFMRLKSGKIWYAPGFAEEHGGLKRWPALLDSILNKQCTPILGPGLSDTLFGSYRELAWQWAKTHHFPMEPHFQEDLPQVAQYLAIEQSPAFLRNTLLEHIHGELWGRYGDELPEKLEEASLYELLKAVGEKHRERYPQGPYPVLAELPFPIYITTTPGNLLEEALIAAGKEPKVEICRWTDYIECPSIFDEEPDYQPTEKQPLIYHLFGCLQNPKSLILTEDDYFDYLIGVTRNETLIPDVVLRALTDTALFFLGFQIDDWFFRVLFRSIIKREGVWNLRQYAHVAAQINPEEGRVLEPERARRYLEQYFHDTQEARISIYWGSVEDFARDLYEHYRMKKGDAT